MRNKTLSRIKKYPPFCQKVWLACKKIPKGKTMSYSQIAKIIGCPGSARAVGTALGKNPFAPFIPCHRVIRKDGKPGGYSGKGGIKRKLELLNMEKKWKS
jgi:methylated-DNA-[protein]-cysteine S-methyltransferase